MLRTETWLNKYVDLCRLLNYLFVRACYCAVWFQHITFGGGAKTVGEARDLGCSAEDFNFDISKGFCKIRPALNLSGTCLSEPSVAGRCPEAVAEVISKGGDDDKERAFCLADTRYQASDPTRPFHEVSDGAFGKND